MINHHSFVNIYNKNQSVFDALLYGNISEELRKFKECIPSECIVDKDDFAANLQWDDWQNHLRELEKSSSVFPTLTITQLSNRIRSISKEFKSYSYPDANKLSGDLFEIFSELFFKILSSDNRIGVYGYQPCPPSDDYGVDGCGVGMDNKPLTVQVKFRYDPNAELTQDDLKQFALQSIVNYRVDPDTKTNMIVFTNAKGLHWVTESKVFSGRVRSIGYSEISTLVDNNTVFWKNVKDMIDLTIKSKY